MTQGDLPWVTQMLSTHAPLDAHCLWTYLATGIGCRKSEYITALALENLDLDTFT